MLERKITKILEDWKDDPNRLPLIIYGARQVGKTTSIMDFANRHYENVIPINFISNPEYCEAFALYDIDAIILKLSLLNPSFHFVPHKTLIFFDEIQAFIDVTTALKFFALDRRFDVISSGSNLGINYHHISSISVGYRQEITMYPLDFEEYLWAYGYPKDLIAVLREHLLNLVPLDDLLLKVLNERYEEYLILGGMPKIIDSFLTTKTYTKSYELQRQLNKDYLDDIKQYAIGLEKAKIENIYRNIYLQLGKENHKFQFTKMPHGARYNQYFGCFDWLKDAGIILVNHNLKELKAPLGLYLEATNFRCYYLDSGLFISFLNQYENAKINLNEEFAIYQGALYENIVYADLVKQGIQNVYFYRSDDATIELDFVIEFKNYILPIEVKSKKGRTISLKNALNKFNNLPLGIKLSKQNIGYQDKILTLPIALTFLLKDLLLSENFLQLLRAN